MSCGFSPVPCIHIPLNTEGRNQIIHIHESGKITPPHSDSVLTPYPMETGEFTVQNCKNVPLIIHFIVS